MDTNASTSMDVDVNYAYFGTSLPSESQVYPTAPFAQANSYAGSSIVRERPTPYPVSTYAYDYDNAYVFAAPPPTAYPQPEPEPEQRYYDSPSQAPYAAPQTTPHVQTPQPHQAAQLLTPTLLPSQMHTPVGARSSLDGRSSSEEQDVGGRDAAVGLGIVSSEGLTEAQRRRKAQNRAAQRAFRERKERHVRTLETKVQVLESSAQSLQTDNERLKNALERAKSENERLRARSRAASAGRCSDGDADAVRAVRSPHSHPSSATTSTDDGHGALAVLSPGSFPCKHEREHSESTKVAVSELWDTILSHPLVREGYVDVADVFERLLRKSSTRWGSEIEVRDVWAEIENGGWGGAVETLMRAK